MTMHEVGRMHGWKFAPETVNFCDSDYCSTENDWLDRIAENNDVTNIYENLTIIRNMGYSYMFESDEYGNLFPLSYGITSIVEPWFRK